jgi:hypothetical protein
MTRLLHQGAIVALLAVVLAFAGCGGGGDGGVPPPPAGDTGTLSGRVVHADLVTAGISGAVVSAINASGVTVASGTTNALGNFSIAGVPVGTLTVYADTPNEAIYGTQSVPRIVVTRNATTSLTIAVLRATDPAPTNLAISPDSVTLDVHGQVDFTAAVTTASGSLDALPTYLISSAVGVVDSQGHFTATQTGNATITAVLGSLQATAAVKVVEARPPQVTSFLVSPTELKATGGKVFVTLAANDGDGITSVTAEIYTPDGGQVDRAMTLDPRTTDTYQVYSTDGLGDLVLGYIVPANSNTPDGTGTQAPQTYSLRVLVRDGSGATAITDFVSFTVKGLDTPPPPG